MKHKKALTTLAISLALVCGMAIGANAAGTLEKISAYLNYGITIKYNGETQNLTDATGARVYPITHNGSTYLPVRAISNILGVDVDWEQATQTVLLGKAGTAANLMEAYQPYTPYQETSLVAAERERGPIFYQNASPAQQIGGEAASSYLCLWGGSDNSSVYDASRTASFNLGGKYSSLTFKAYANEDVTLTVMGDNDAVLGTFQLKKEQIPQTLTVNLENVSQLTFRREPLAAPGLDLDLVTTYIFSAQLS